MAQPDSVQANGIPGPDHAESPQPEPQSVLPVKRKRDDADDGDEANGDEPEKMEVDIEAPQVSHENKKEAIRNYYTALSSFDANPSILKRPLPEPDADQPDAKRQKAESSTSIADKFTHDKYAHLEELASDLVNAVRDQLKELQSAQSDKSNDEVDGTAAIQTKKFQEKAMDLLRREISYPHSSAMATDAKPQTDPISGQAVLTVFGLAPHGKQLFSSLPKKTPGKQTSGAKASPLDLPPPVSTSWVLPTRSNERTATLGDLFSSSRPLPPLQPPKQPKQMVKGNVLGFYHPEPAGKSKYFHDSYSSKKVAVGYYLDYTNATPSSKSKTRQRERAQSLAGRRPSAAELEVNEMESLFRSAFSSFAPCRDDSTSVIPSTHAGRLHWQLTGQRNFNKLIESELQQYEDEEPAQQETEKEVDEEFVNEAIEKWDDWLVDPALQDMNEVVSKPKEKDPAEKEVDDLLNDVTDMIETLLSYQRIRNLTLPSSQNRYADPVNGDMLSHGAASTPTEEETATYETLKAQLSLIINTLPPYAVAKLNGDQLEQLLVSTKLEVRTDQYKGVMDDAAAQARLRQQQNVAAVPQNRPAPHRTPSASTPYNQYGANQYGTPSRTPSIAPTNYYRPGQQPPMPPQQGSMPRPGGTPHHMPPHQTPRPGQPGGYRPANGYTNYAQHVGKAQTPYGHQGVQYGSQQRPPQYPGYAGTPQHGTPNTRFQQPFQQPYQQQHHQPPSTPQPNYGGYYANGNNMQPRMSPQVPAGQYQSPTPHQQQRHYGATPQQNMPGTPINRQQYPNGSHQPQHTPNTMPGYNMGGYETDHRKRMAAEQARFRAAAQQTSNAFGNKMIAGGHEARLAAIPAEDPSDGSPNVRARMAAGTTPKPQSPVGSAGRNGTPPIPHKVTPVPVPVIPQQQQRKPA
ncbi:hypothetical protein CkaCkLH20_09038 [Colletotrichum karsti]|uniref:Uncharacterized protein n=1 Tax=Colletotrichum karsti TaxID=1095194 RepID=A0A9P6I013_9PEZI|nr:uncharacterized protein CkaCkLH20_09038 [Colletotrichum karsti]KAF9873579.1 hypothetical protein CkaCkLH20_09038 [Colletotrichum karsti]